MKKHLLLFLPLSLLGFINTSAQGLWTQRADYTATPRSAAVAFSIGTGGYIGTGYDSTSFKRNFRIYVQASGLWMDAASLGGSTGNGLSRNLATAFVIGSKAYVATGQGGSPYLNDVWEYDAGSDSWTQKANFGGTPRRAAVSFTINGKGYLGTGQDATGMKNDFWEYDPTLNTWTQKAAFGGTARKGAVGFAISSKGYICTGDDGTLKKDLWEYNPSSNTWTQLTPFGGTPRSGAAAFVVYGKAYVGTGYDISFVNKNDFWEFNPSTNAWTQVASFPGTARSNAVAFSIGDRGYLGTGHDGTVRGDFWEFSAPVGIGEQQAMHSAIIYPNPMVTQATLRIEPSISSNAGATLLLYSMRGEKVREMNVTGDAVQIERGDLSNGVYLFSIITGKGSIASGRLVVAE
jgi:hypothetical protein